MKKTIKKRAFISAIAMLIVSAIVLTSSTFAWFSMALNGTVEMDLTIASADGIQISANTSAFTTALTMDDFNGTSGTRYAAYEGNKNNFPEELSPVSTICTVSSTNLNPAFFKGSIDANKKANIEAVTDEVGSGFVAFDIFIQLAKNTTVYFDESKILGVVGKDAKGDPITDENAEFISAMRIAMVNRGLVEKGAAATAIEASKPDTIESVKMLEPNNDKHTEIATKKGASGVMTTNYIGKAGTGLTCNSTYTNIVNHGAGYTTGTNASTDCTLSCKTGINHIRVYIWLEGQDVDCANDIAGSVLKVNLSFDILPET